MQDRIDVVKEEFVWRFFLKFSGKDGRENQYIGVAKNGARLEIVYQSYFADKKGFLEDLFRQTEAPRALQGGRSSNIVTKRSERRRQNGFDHG